PGPHGGPVDRAALCASAAFRSGARVGLDVAAAHASATSLRLLQALPGGLDDARRAALQREADDLRAALVHLIVAAHTSLVLASPFWDDDTVEDLGALLRDRKSVV